MAAGWLLGGEKWTAAAAAAAVEPLRGGWLGPGL